MALHKNGVIYFRRGENPQLSRNFTGREFECPCGLCEIQRVSSELVERLQVIRDAVDAPIIVTSGYRCKEYQELLRKRGYETATGTSTHELGQAADIVIAGTKSRFVWYAEMLFKAIGDGGNWMHVDLRRDKVRRWGYQATEGQEDLGKMS